MRRRQGRGPGNARPLARVAAPPSFREDENRVAVLDDIPHVAQRLARADRALREREGVEEERRQVVVEAVGEPLATAVTLRKEVRVEEFLHHRRCGAIAPARRQGIENDRCVEMALMVGREDHGTLDVFQMLEPGHRHAREYAAKRKDPRRQADSSREPRPGGSVPRWENDGRWAMADGRFSVADGRWPMVAGRFSMADRRLPFR